MLLPPCDLTCSPRVLTCHHVTPRVPHVTRYASFDYPTPDAEHHNFSSMRAGLSTDVLRFSSAQLCTRRPCSLYLGVFGYQNASFSLVATQVSCFANDLIVPY